MERILRNLIANAVESVIGSGRQGGLIRVLVQIHDDKHVRIVVADTGPGMSPDFVRERLFRPFETTKPAGMGIGVYESQQYVAGLGGHILVDSKEGSGTRVRLLLPQGGGSVNPASMKEAA